VNYDLRKIRRLALDNYTLKLEGIHGISHWQRVQENGMRLARRNGANKDVVILFALLHDCCRKTDGRDIDHGPRAADFTSTLLGMQIQGEQSELEQLLVAIRDHTQIIHSTDLTIGTCWDADRLDIGRIGIKPARKYFNTETAKDNLVFKWAYERSRNR
jgi:uncharacterized protein